MINLINPREAAEESIYDRAAHLMHERAILECKNEHRAYTHVFYEWNKDFTGWRITGHVEIKHYGSGFFGLTPAVHYPHSVECKFCLAS